MLQAEYFEQVRSGNIIETHGSRHLYHVMISDARLVFAAADHTDQSCKKNLQRTNSNFTRSTNVSYNIIPGMLSTSKHEDFWSLSVAERIKV